jgi:hypothetical protein
LISFFMIIFVLMYVSQISRKTKKIIYSDMKENQPIEEIDELQDSPEPQEFEPDEYDNWHPHFF